MGVSLGEMNAILTRRQPGRGAAALASGIDSIREARRHGRLDAESNRRALATEGMNARRQDEIERASAERESFAREREGTRSSEADREFKKQVFDQTWKLFQEGTADSTRAAINLGKQAGFDFDKMSPEEFQRQRATLEAEGKRDEARAAEAAAKAAADEADEWLAGSGDEQAIAVDDVVRGGEAAIAEMDAGVGQADPSAQSAMVVQAANEALKRAGAAPGMQLGMGLPPAPQQQIPQQARPAPGPPQAAPVQQQGPPLGAPPVRGLPPGMQAAMGGMPPRPQPGPTPQAPGVVQSPTAFTWNGMRMDPYVSNQKRLQDLKNMGLARMSQSMLDRVMAQSEGAEGEKAEIFTRMKAAIPAALLETNGDQDAAWKLLAAPLDHYRAMELRGRTGRRRGGGGGGPGATRGYNPKRTIEMATGRRRVAKIALKHGVAKTKLALQGLSKVGALLVGGNLPDGTTAQEAARIWLLREGRGETGALSEGDVVRSTGNQGAAAMITGWIHRLQSGGLNPEALKAMAAEVKLLEKSAQAQLEASKVYTSRAVQNAVSWSEEGGTGARDYYGEMYGEDWKAPKEASPKPKAGKLSSKELDDMLGID